MAALAAAIGESEAAVVRMAVRRMARQELRRTARPSPAENQAAPPDPADGVRNDGQQPAVAIERSARAVGPEREAARAGYGRSAPGQESGSVTGMEAGAGHTAASAGVQEQIHSSEEIAAVKERLARARGYPPKGS